MADIRDLTVRIRGDTSGFDKSMDNVKGKSESTGFSIGKLAGGVLVGNVAFAAASKATQLFGDIISSTKDQINENQASLAQLDAVLKSTHGSAGVTRDEVIKLGDSLQNQTTYSNDAIVSAQNMLLTFTNIHSNVFPATTKAVLDMSTAMHQDLQSTAVMVGKALQDPVQGVTALQRVGVRLTDQQKAQVKQMVAVGDAAGAQKIILGELANEFGGSAAAATQTFAGKMAQVKNGIGDAEKKVGTFLINAVTPMMSKLLNFVTSDKFQTWVEKTGKEFMAVADKVVTFLKPSLDALFKTIKTDLMPTLEKLWKNIIEPLAPVIGAILVGAIWLLINALNVAIKVLSWVEDIIIGVEGRIVSLVLTIIHWFERVAPSIRSAFTTVESAITAPFKAAFNSVARMWNDTAGKIDFKAPSWVPGFGGKGFSMPKIPLLAQGGIVDRATLAMIGEGNEPEAVVPLSKLPQVAQSMGSSGNQSPINITLNFNVGMYAGMPVEKRQIALDLWKEIVRGARAQGVQLPMIGAVGVQ